MSLIRSFRNHLEIKNDRDVSRLDFLCEIDDCHEKATHETKVGFIEHPGGETFLLCDQHLDEIFEIYERFCEIQSEE